jgi:hypothetical protein
MMLPWVIVLAAALTDPSTPARASESAPTPPPQDLPDRALLEFLSEFPDDEELEISADAPSKEPEND